MLSVRWTGTRRRFRALSISPAGRFPKGWRPPLNGTAKYCAYMRDPEHQRGARSFYICSAIVVLVIFSSLLYLVDLSHTAHRLFRPIWSASTRAQEAGELDPVLFREALYRETDDRLQAVLTVEPTAEHTHTVVMLHGLSMWAADFARMVRRSWAPRHPGIRWILPQGPRFNVEGVERTGWYQPFQPSDSERPVIEAWAPVMNDLYDASQPQPLQLPDSADAFSDGRFWEDEEQMMKSVRMIWDLLSRDVVGSEPGKVSWDKLILSGFSQGGILSLLLATTMPILPAGVQVWSSHVPMRTHQDRLALNVGRNLNLSWSHGTNDPLFSPPLVDYSLGVLRHLGYEVEFSWAEGVAHEFGPLPAQQEALERLMQKVWT